MHQYRVRLSCIQTICALAQAHGQVGTSDT